MLTLSFGEPTTRRTRSGVTLTTGSLALHIQCAWRIIREGVILAGLSDYTTADNEEQALEYLKSRLSHAFLHEPSVTAVTNVAAGGFTLHLSNATTIEAFPSLSQPDADAEFWRLFRPGSSGPHFVVGPTGAQLDGG